LQLGKNSVLEVEIGKNGLEVFGVKTKFGHDVSHCQCNKSCLNRYQNCLKLPKTTKICPKTIELIIKYWKERLQKDSVCSNLRTKKWTREEHGRPKLNWVWLILHDLMRVLASILILISQSLVMHLTPKGPYVVFN
jgi:hypothetical protein